MENSASIHDRISQIVDYYGNGKNTTFAKIVGESEANVRGYRISVIPKHPFLEKVVRCFDISPEWLLTGNGPMLRKPVVAIPKENQERVATAIPSDEGIPLIPLDAMAGFCAGNSTQVLDYECERYVVPSFRGTEFMIQVKGSSMYPKYSSGDIVACKCLPLDTFFQWNKVYVADTEQGVVIKRVMPGKDKDHIKMVSENERYPPFEIHKSEITSLAIVIGVIRLE